MSPGFSNGWNLRKGAPALLCGGLVGDCRGKLWLRSVDLFFSRLSSSDYLLSWGNVNFTSYKYQMSTLGSRP